MRKFDILSRDLNIYGSHFLEASAGTGKTFAIEHLVIRLLIEGKNPLRIDQILVVTFTRAATRELKQRICESLHQTAHRFEELPYLKAIVELGEAAVLEAKQRLADALVCFDQCQIFTVHGFCHRMLSECAFEAQVGFDLAGPDEGAHRTLVQDTMLHCLRTGLEFPKYSSMQLYGVLKKHLWKMGRCVKAIKRTLNRNRNITAFPSFFEVHERIQHVLALLGKVDFDQWLEDFFALRGCYKEMKGSVNEEQAAILGRWLQLGSCSLEELDHFLIQEELFLEKMVPENLMKRAKVPESCQLNYPSLISELQTHLLPLLHIAQDRGKTFLRIAQDCREACQKTLVQSEAFSPDALLEKMRDALKTPSFVARIRGKYRAAIVDEFQDTDPLQWEIFQKLFLGHTDVFCLVGDPKQSIYAFRNADVYTYLAAAEALGEESRAYLDTNFRSSAPLVGALNRLFATGSSQSWMRLPAKGISLPVPSVKTTKLPEAQGSIHFLLAEAAATPLTRKWPQEALFYECYFPMIAHEIVTLKESEGIPWEEIVILVSDRYQARQVFDYLKKNQIPACVKRGGALTDTPAYHALKELLEAVLSPTDVGKLKRLLAGPLIGWTAEQVLGDSLLVAKAQLMELHELLHERGFAFFFQAFMKQMQVDQTLLQAKELSLYADLRQLGSILIEQELTAKLSKQGLLQFLEELQTLDSEEENWLKIRASEEQGSIAIMTTHLSKGLEFDTVFALGSVVRQGPKDQIVLTENGGSRIALLDHADAACRLALEEADAEKLRQFYVALTRAKTRVVVPLAFNTGYRNGLKLGHASACELFCAQFVNPEGSYEERYETIRQLRRDQLCTLLDGMKEEASIRYSVIEPGMTLNSLATEPSVPVLNPPPVFIPSGRLEYLRSFTSLAQKSESDREVLPQELSLFPTPHTLPLGADTGILFHALIEKVLRAELHFPYQSQKVAELVQQEVKDGPLKEWGEVLFQMIHAALHSPLGSFTLRDIPPDQMLQEMEFAYPISDGMMKGFADLVFEWDGKYYLLDWKTNYLGPTDREYKKEHLISCMKANDYETQASIYAEALRRYVKLFDTRPFEACFGGALYVFVRGNAVLHFIPKGFTT